MSASGMHISNEEPLVSVVMPFYNSERFLKEAVDSVLGQTYRNWELLLVDDGSTDSSRGIAENLMTLRPNQIYVLEHPGHRGLPASRNLGIEQARGEYIASLDSDDAWLPSRLETQLELVVKDPDIGMVCGPSWYWFSWTGSAADRDLDMRRELKLEYNRRYEPPELLHKLLLAEIHSPATGSMLIRRSLLLEVGGYVEDFPAMYEDQVLLAKIMLRTPVYVSGEALDRYRQHDESMTALARSSITDVHVPLSPERKVFLEWVARYLAGLEYSNPELDQTVESALAPYRHLWHHRLTHPPELARWVASRILPVSWQRAMWRRLRRWRRSREEDEHQ